MDNILASGISNREHLAAFDKVAAARFAALEIEKALIYVIDTVDVDALLPLAEQFDLMGYKGWRLAKTEQEKRALIKKAVELHRYKGTPYAIKEALKSVGFFNTIIQERVGQVYDGSSQFNGLINYGGGNWATFRVIFDLGSDKGINDEQTADLLALVNEYKNVRSVFLGFSWKATLEEVVEASDDLSITMIFSQDVEKVADGIDYDGTATYGGLNLYNNQQDFLEVTEIPEP